MSEKIATERPLQPRRFQKERKRFFYADNEVFDYLEKIKPNFQCTATTIYMFMCRLVDEKGICWPSIDCLMKRTSRSKQHVIDVLADMISVGLIARNPPGAPKMRSNVYMLLELKPEFGAQAPPEEEVHEVDPEVNHVDPKVNEIDLEVHDVDHERVEVHTVDHEVHEVDHQTNGHKPVERVEVHTVDPSERVEVHTVDTTKTQGTKTHKKALSNESVKKAAPSLPSSTNEKPIRSSGLSPDEAQSMWFQLINSDPLGERLTTMQQVMAEQNQSGEVAVTRVWRVLGERFAKSRAKYPEITDEAWDFGFDRAIDAEAPNIGYALKAAKGYKPGKKGGGRRSSRGANRKKTFELPEEETAR